MRLSPFPVKLVRVAAGLALLCFGAALSFSETTTTPTRLPERTSAWLRLSPADHQQVMSFGEEIKSFLNAARQNQMAVAELIRQAQAHHFVEYTPGMALPPGTRFYVSNRGRALLLGIVGTQGGAQGFRFIDAHVDSPWLDLKANPLVEKHGFVLFHTLTHGGLKRYQWVNRPLSLTGHIDRVDGTRVQVAIGLKPGDPVFVIPDVAPHVDRPFRSRTYTEVLSPEEMLPVAANEPLQNGGVMAQALKQLFDLYHITPEEFVSAELILTPAEPAADVGLDRSMIGAYGQDDRLNAFIAAHSLMTLAATPRKTSLVFLANNEEVGGVNNTGAESEFLNSMMTHLLSLELGARFTATSLRQAKDATEVISADCNTGINPNFPQVQEPDNAARLGYGVTIKRYGHGFDANSEYLVRFLRLFDEQKIAWQTSTYMESVGGGGTDGGIYSRQNMEVIDLGIPLLSMHSPYEASSKVDAWEMFRAMQGFFGMP